MSYILDALRRADAERERGGVPGLHAQQPQRADGERRRRAGLPWAGIAAALGLSLLVVLAWLVLAPASPPPVVVAATAPLPVTPAPVEPAPVPAPAAITPAPTPAVQPPQQPALPPPVPVPVARAPAARAEATAPKPQAAPAPVAAPAASAAPARLPALRELPEETRRQLPSLVIGGSTWSENAASRFVILNGQLLRENDPVAPELVLRQIRPRAVVLEFRGQRFELSY